VDHYLLCIGLYDRQKLLGGTQEYSLVFNATTIGIVLVIAAGFLNPDFVFARGWLLLAWIFAFLLAAMGDLYFAGSVSAEEQRVFPDIRCDHRCKQ